MSRITLLSGKAGATSLTQTILRSARATSLVHKRVHLVAILGAELSAIAWLHYLETSSTRLSQPMQCTIHKHMSQGHSNAP